MNQLEKNWNQYLKKQASHQELFQLLVALNNVKQSTQIDELMDNMWEKSSDSDGEFKINQEGILRNIKKEIHPQSHTHAKTHRKLYQRISYIAVASLILLVSLLGWFLSSNDNPKMIQYVVKTGEKAQRFVLPDQSIVWLNVASSLQFYTDFSSNRSVILDGEAYFEVVSDQENSFKVVFGQHKLRVTGTKFDVKAYANDQDALITLKEGSVMVYNQSDTSNLNKGERLIIQQKTGTFHKIPYPFEDTDIWKESKLAFRDVPLNQVLNSIERYYNVKIKLLKSSIQKPKLLTVTYAEDTPLEEVMKGLSFLHDIKYTFIQSDSLIVEYE